MIIQRLLEHYETQLFFANCKRAFSDSVKFGKDGPTTALGGAVGDQPGSLPTRELSGRLLV